LSAPTSETQQQDLLALTPLIRRVVAARVRDPQVVDDLVQETFARWPVSPLVATVLPLCALDADANTRPATVPEQHGLAALDGPSSPVSRPRASHDAATDGPARSSPAVQKIAFRMGPIEGFGSGSDQAALAKGSREAWPGEAWLVRGRLFGTPSQPVIGGALNSPIIPVGFGSSPGWLAARDRSVDAAERSRRGETHPLSTGALEGLDD
jgi:hypothetical protein